MCISFRGVPYTESRFCNTIVDHLLFQHCKMNGRGNASGSSIHRLSNQTTSKAAAGNKRQCQCCRNYCVKEFIKCTFCDFVFHAKFAGVSAQQFSLFREQLDRLKTPFESLCSTCRKVDVKKSMKTAFNANENGAS